MPHFKTVVGRHREFNGKLAGGTLGCPIEGMLGGLIEGMLGGLIEGMLGPIEGMLTPLP